MERQRGGEPHRMSTSIPLTKAQADLLEEFYAIPLRRVLLTKPERDGLWKSFKVDRRIPASLDLAHRCPALLAELNKSIDSGNNVQSAVFSECVYAQALADQFKLGEFFIHNKGSQGFAPEVREILESNALVPRYVYSNETGSRLLIQAGGHGGVDGALISVVDKAGFMIEFKEPGAKTSEADLPAYEENGNMLSTGEFEKKYPQFVPMIREQLDRGLNFWERAGSNINEFSLDSLVVAVTGNYSGMKFAHVICTEDSVGNLTMIPATEVPQWAELEGEIRPAGRNHYRVWTRNRLHQFIEDIGGEVEDGVVNVPTSGLSTATPRGGTGVNRYKIGPLFFVYAHNVTLHGTVASFSLNDVQQLRPTIAAKMFFKNLDASAVRDHYWEEFKHGRNN